MSQPRGEDELIQAVREALKGVHDPELGASVVDLGMVKRIQVANGHAEIDLALTMAGCPLAPLMAYQAEQTVSQVPGIDRVTVHILEQPLRATPRAPWEEWLAQAEEEDQGNDERGPGGRS